MNIVVLGQTGESPVRDGCCGCRSARRGQDGPPPRGPAAPRLGTIRCPRTGASGRGSRRRRVAASSVQHEVNPDRAKPR